MSGRQPCLNCSTARGERRSKTAAWPGCPNASVLLSLRPTVLFGSALPRLPSSEREFGSFHPLHDEGPGRRPGPCLRSTSRDARPATAVFGFHTFVAAPIAKSASSRWLTPGTLFIPPGPSGARLEELEDGQVARPIAAKQSHEYQYRPGGSYGSHGHVRQAEEGQPDNASSDQHNCGGYP